MEIRTGFVSNSSASSFIVALSPACDHNDFLDLFHPAHCDSEATEVFSRDYDHIIESLEDDWRGWSNDVRDATAEMNGLRDLGWEIVYLRISYHDHKALDMLDTKIKHGDLKTLFMGD